MYVKYSELFVEIMIKKNDFFKWRIRYILAKKHLVRNYNLNYDSCILDFSLPRFLSFPEINAANVAEYLHSMAKKKKKCRKVS